MIITSNQLEVAERNLRRFLQLLNRKNSLKILWEVSRIVSEANFSKKSSSLIYNLPKEGLSDKLDAGVLLSHWQIEQAANLIAIFSREYISEKNFVDFRDWRNISRLFRLIYDYNERVSEKFLNDKNVFLKLSQISSQQFMWQDGTMGLSALARFAYIYSGPECSKLCEKKFGLSASDFFSYGFILVSEFSKNCELKLPYDMSIVGGDNRKLRTVLKQFSINFSDIKSKSRSLRKANFFGEFSKSVFRPYPIIQESPLGFFCINPSQIVLRFTSGLINEVSGDDGAVRNEVGHRFEGYLKTLLNSSFPKNDVKEEEQYGSRKARKHTPDVRIYDSQNHLQIILECKSTRLNFDSKFDLKNLEGLPDRSNEIIKGFIQVWKYLADINDGKANENLVSRKVYGIVVTLEPWIQLNQGRYDAILAKAHEEADENNIPNDFRVKVVLTSIGELEYVTPRVSYSDFISVLEETKKPELNGYMLQNVFIKNYPNSPIIHKFDSIEILTEVIWYWGTIQKMKADLQNAQ